MKAILNICGLLALALSLPSHADGAAIARDQCAGCHALDNPDYASSPVAERRQRSAPPLYYAGNKYRQDWLVQWLQQPQRLHPAGYYPPDHIGSAENGDTVDTASLPAHPELDAGQAQQVAEYLMSLRAHSELIERDSYQPGTVALRMGMMDFRKFKGCDACHRDTPTDGGLSGPELHSAWQRLQPAYISSYIADPVAWDAHSMMPVMEMNDAAVHKLVHYLKALGEQ